MKAKPIGYWVTTTVIGLETLAGGVTDLIRGRTMLVAGPFVADTSRVSAIPFTS